MASVEKRAHVPTEKMQEFMNMRLNKDPETSLQKVLKCPQPGCNKVLTSSPGLRYHMKTHSGLERPYSCAKCCKTFKSANGLKYHTEKTKCEEQYDRPSSAINLTPVFAREGTHLGAGDSQCMTTDEMVPFAYSQTIDWSGHSGGGDPTSHDDNDSTDTEDELPTMSSQKPHRPIPPPLSLSLNPHTSHLDLPGCSQSDNSFRQQEHNWLTELAIIATGPQSPLLQKTNPISCLGSPTREDHGSLDRSIHSYARPPRSPLPVPDLIDPDVSISTTTPTSTPPKLSDNSDERVSSSSPFPASPKETTEADGTWSHMWPTAVWQCFIKDSRIRFLSGSKLDWQLAQDLANKEALAAQASMSGQQTDSYAPNGLRLLNIEECKPTEVQPDQVIRLRLMPDASSGPELLAECATDHPFFVKNKGWSSFHPGLTAEHYGIPCNELEVDDVCLPPSHPDATFTTDVFESFKCFDFTPMDSSAVFTLSSMAKQRRDQELSPKSSPGSPTRRKPLKSEPITKAKRPMNAFMLFAKKFRVEYTHKFPGKDNRAISVLLGDRWKKMKTEERRIFAEEAKVLAEQHRKIHPDCWKRKRAASGNLES